MEVAELTLVSLVCEDLAEHDDIAQLVRAVGPTVVFAVLLDGPQLSSRWAARYASVLADDPGSAVLTLTSFGMVERSRPHRRDVSPIIALCKDSVSGFREIPLETGAHAVVLTVCMDRATRRSADGRWPVDNGTRTFGVAVHQIRASNTGSPPATPRVGAPSQHHLDLEELTVLTAWAEAAAEALAHAPERAFGVLSEGRSEAGWRKPLGLAEPSQQLDAAIESMNKVLRTALALGNTSTLQRLAAVLRDDQPDEQDLDRFVRRLLLAMLEERGVRQPQRAFREVAWP
jgi:hypothetical protein